MSTFTARYRGNCAACPEPVYKGQEATYDAQGDVVHVDCATDDLTPQKAICETCWLEKPCECDEDSPTLPSQAVR